MGTIPCGAAMCDAANQQCCIHFVGGRGGGVTSACTPQETACVAGISLTCASGLNCTNGDVCCVSFGGGFGGFNVTGACQPSCSIGFGGSIQLCSTSAECPPFRPCIPTPFGLGVCQ